jgi:hypothetical protein
MKTLRLITAILILSTTIISCKQYSQEEMVAFQDVTIPDESENAAASPGPCNPNAYEVTLESRTLIDGNWEWIWSVRNPNPGNGSDGTAKDLSHWGMRLADCINWSSVTGAAYSANGTEWTSFTPVNEVEGSQDCLATAVVKFDFGTTGTAKSYYRLVLSQEHPIGTTLAYYKSGQTCCTFNFTGIGCSGGPVEIVE